MENEIYKVDRSEITQQQESRATVKITEIEDRCNVPVISFIKNNYGFVKIRSRKTEPEIKFLIGAALLKAAVHLGLKDIDNLHKPDIINAIFNHFSDLTLEEIYKAFELERYGQYNEKTEHYQLFNAEYVTAILKKYKAYKHLIKSEHNILPGKSEHKELSQEEKDQVVINAVNRVFDEYKETGTIEGITEYLFDFLLEKGKIKQNNTPALNKYYQAKMDEAAAELKKEIEKAEAKSPAEKREFKADLEKIISGKSNKIIIRAKKNILMEFFKNQIELKHQTIF